MDLILGRLLRNVGYQYCTEKACHCCNGSSLAGTSLRCSGQWIRVCAEAPPPSYRAILRPFCAIAPPRNTRWLGSAPFTEIRCYAGLIRGPKNGLEICYKSGPVSSFLNLGPKSGLVFGSEKRTQNCPPEPSKTGTSRTRILPSIACGACDETAPKALRTSNVSSKALQISLNAVIELYACKKLLAAAPRANCCRSGEPNVSQQPAQNKVQKMALNSVPQKARFGLSTLRPTHEAVKAHRAPCHPGLVHSRATTQAHWVSESEGAWDDTPTA